MIHSLVIYICWQNVTFVSSAPPAALDSTPAGDFLRVLVLSGTSLKQYCVPYKPDDRVSAVLRALQTMMGPEAAQLVDYQMYVH